MLNSLQRERFHRLFIEHQRAVYAHLYALLTNVSDVEEVFQTTCVVLLDKADQYQEGTDFRAWATRVAELEAYNYRRRQQTERQRFSDALVETLADQRTAMTDELTLRAAALRQCMQKLPVADRDLVQQRYAGRTTTKQLAERLGRSVEGLYKSIQRVRGALRQCIERSLAAEERTQP